MRGTEVITLRKKESQEQVQVIRRKNQIPLPNLNNFVNAVYYWLSGSAPKIQNCPSNGMILLNGDTVITTLSIQSYYVAGVNNNVISIVFFAEDSSSSCYTTTAQKLIVKIAGYNIYLSLGNITATKKSCCTLSINWIISFCVTGSLSPIYTTLCFINLSQGSVSSGGASCVSCTINVINYHRTGYFPIYTSYPINSINLYLFSMFWCTTSTSSCVYTFCILYGTCNGITCYWIQFSNAFLHPQDNIITFFGCAVQGAKMYYFGVTIVYNINSSAFQIGAGLIVYSLGGGVTSARTGYQVSLCFTV